MSRGLVILLIAIAIFLPFNWLALRQLLAVHPRRRRWILGALVAGNLMWPFFPLLRSSTDFARWSRAILGPLWFGWTSFTILYCAFTLLVLLTWLPFRRRPFAEWARWPSRVFLATLLAGSVVGYVQAVVPLRVERVTIRVPSLPASAEGMRLVLLGDLHVGVFTRPSRLERIFRTAAEAEPYAVLMAGDLIDDDPYFVPKLLAGAGHLPAPIPLYAVLGNHEIYGDPFTVIRRLKDSRIRLLVNEGVPLGELWLAGVSDPAATQMGNDARLAPDLDAALRGKPPAALPILLAHQPKALDDARKRNVPVLLSAHTHGGQLGIRALRWSLAGVFLRYHMGLYDVSPTQLYINTGTGYWLFPFRLGMTPEVTVVELAR
jgi:predicted MPP superfamily phosphohydrolase